MATDVPDPLRQVLGGRHVVQQFVLVSLASGFPCSASVAPVDVQVYLDLCLTFLLLHFSLRVCSFLLFTLMVRRFLKRWS